MRAIAVLLMVFECFECLLIVVCLRRNNTNEKIDNNRNEEVWKNKLIFRNIINFQFFTGFIADFGGTKGLPEPFPAQSVLRCGTCRHEPSGLHHPRKNFPQRKWHSLQKAVPCVPYEFPLRGSKWQPIGEWFLFFFNSGWRNRKCFEQRVPTCGTCSLNDFRRWGSSESYFWIPFVVSFEEDLEKRVLLQQQN